MNPREVRLNELLRTARVPERTPEYWEEFPRTVVRQIDRPVPSTPESATRGHLCAWGLGLATACLVLGFFAGFGRGQAAGFSTAELAESQKIYQEVATLFPDRLQTVLLDGRGSQLVLAADAQPHSSAPLLVQICHAGVCSSFITFSGQRVQLNGEAFEVLSDAMGNVLVVGERLAWTSGEPRNATAGYRIRATALGEML